MQLANFAPANLTSSTRKLAGAAKSLHSNLAMRHVKTLILPTPMRQRHNLPENQTGALVRNHSGKIPACPEQHFSI
jgi:hypothetical protein